MKLVITMSRRTGTGAHVIAEELSQRLNIPLYDKAYLQKTFTEEKYKTEEEVIRKLAEQPCIILGRCAADILKDRLNVFNIYVSAPKEVRIQRIMELNSLSYEDAKKEVEETDEARAAYYHKQTGKSWGDVNNYHMILDTHELGIENCANILMQYFERLEYI